MKHEISIENLNSLPEAVTEFLNFLEENRLKKIAFSGKMGAGKTTFITALIKKMGVDDAIHSPTFSLVNEHLSIPYGAINHFDFYRIDSEEEAYDIGVEEYFYDDSYCFIEWPEKIENVLPSQCLWVNLLESEGKRKLLFEL